jgi:hypothetical protein
LIGIPGGGKTRCIIEDAMKYLRPQDVPTFNPQHDTFNPFTCSPILITTFMDQPRNDLATHLFLSKQRTHYSFLRNLFERNVYFLHASSKGTLLVFLDNGG